MTKARFWIVGGEYASTDFTDLVAGSARVFGPYGERRAAEDVWRRVSEDFRSQCLVRFTIAAEGMA